jgi:hypothetical protein
MQGVASERYLLSTMMMSISIEVNCGIAPWA